MNDEEKTPLVLDCSRDEQGNATVCVLFTSLVCVLHLKPFFQPVDIQHSQCLCPLSDPREIDFLLSRTPQRCYRPVIVTFSSICMRTTVVVHVCSKHTSIEPPWTHVFIPNYISTGLSVLISYNNGGLIICVFFTLNRSCYPSSSSTTSARSDSFILKT